MLHLMSGSKHIPVVNKPKITINDMKTAQKLNVESFNSVKLVIEPIRDQKVLSPGPAV